MNDLDVLIKNRKKGKGLLKYYDNSVISTQSFAKPSHPYENGIFITIQNHKCLSADIYLQLKDLYTELCNSFLPEEKKIEAVKLLVGKVPSEKVILDLCYKKIPILVCGIHNYDATSNQTGRGSKSNSWYQHSHYYLYGIHHYLKEDKIEKWKSKAKGLLMRKFSKQTKLKKDDVVDIRDVGGGKYYYNDKITPTTLYDYLKTPYTNPSKDCLINYISKHQSHYPTSILYKGN